jgi:hypothetical protein
MKKFLSLAAVATLSMGLAPLSAFAASATTNVSEEDVMQALDAKPAMMQDRGGGGESVYPGPYGNGITVDGMITKEVTPDYVAVNGYCEVTDLDSRDAIRTELTRTYNEIKTAVGADGRVRRNGAPSVYPYYDAYGSTSTGKMSGNLSIMIRVTNVSAAQRIADVLDEHGCNPSWDVRLVNAEDYETGILDELLAKVNKRKAVFEKLLGKKLTNVTGASLYTYLDGYSSYDPETNKADAQTTLSITFDLGATKIRPMPMTKSAVPKG